MHEYPFSGSHPPLDSPATPSGQPAWYEMMSQFLQPRASNPWLQALQLGVPAGAALLQSRAEGSRNVEDQRYRQELMERQFAADQERRRDQQAMAQAAMLQTFLGSTDARAGVGLASTQMDPYAQAKSLARLQLYNQGLGDQRYTLNKDLSESGGWSGPKELAGVSPDALVQAMKQFNLYRAAAAPGTQILGGDADVEAARQARLGEIGGYQGNIMNYLGNVGSTGAGAGGGVGDGQRVGFGGTDDAYAAQIPGISEMSNEERRALGYPVRHSEAPKGTGMPWWKKLAIGASFALPFAGPALGLGLLGTTAASAGLGALTGGRRGAAMGALGAFGSGVMSGGLGAVKNARFLAPRAFNMSQLANPSMIQGAAGLQPRALTKPQPPPPPTYPTV